VSIPLFSGAYDDLTDAELSSMISETSFINMYLIYNFTQALELSDRLAALSGYTARLYQLMNYLTPPKKPEGPGPDGEEKLLVVNGYSKVGAGDDEATPEEGDKLLKDSADDHTEPGIFVRDLAIFLPSQEPLLRNLSFQVTPGETLLLTGPSGTCFLPPLFLSSSLPLFTLHRQLIDARDCRVRKVVCLEGFEASLDELHGLCCNSLLEAGVVSAPGAISFERWDPSGPDCLPFNDSRDSHLW